MSGRPVNVNLLPVLRGPENCRADTVNAVISMEGDL